MDEPDWIKCSKEIVHGRHTPFDCRDTWAVHKTSLSSRKPSIPTWTAREIMNFWETWKKDGADWPLIAKNLRDIGFEYRTPENCSKAFHYLVKKGQELELEAANGEIDMDQTFDLPPKKVPTPFRWTPEYVQKFKSVVQGELDRTKELEKQGLHNKEENDIRWAVVSKQLNIGADALICKNLWTKMSSGAEWNKPIERRGRMREREVELLIETVNKENPKYSKDWDRIHEHFPMSSRPRLRPTWFKATLKHLTESYHRMNRLEQAVLNIGEYSWAKVAKEMMSKDDQYTTGLQCKAAWDTKRMVTNPTWDADELEKLIQSVDELSRTKMAKSRARSKEAKSKAKSSTGPLFHLSTKDWMDIGKSFYPSKTSLQCRTKWTEIKNPQDSSNQDLHTDIQILSSAENDTAARIKGIFIWTEDRTRALLAAVNKFGPIQLTFDNLARQLGCTPRTCRVRWQTYTNTCEVRSINFLWDEARKKVLYDTIADFSQKGRDLTEAFHHVATLIDCPPEKVKRYWKRQAREAASQDLDAN